MYLHLGYETVVRTDNILGVFDMDNTTISKHTREYLKLAQQEGRVINVSMELPKSFVVCNEQKVERVYITQIATSTILKRMENSSISVL